MRNPSELITISVFFRPLNKIKENKCNYKILVGILILSVSFYAYIYRGREREREGKFIIL